MAIYHYANHKGYTPSWSKKKSDYIIVQIGDDVGGN